MKLRKEFQCVIPYFQIIVVVIIGAVILDAVLKAKGY